MIHDTWMFELDDLERLLGWIDEQLPSLDRVVEPVIAATRLPRPEGPPVLLLHTTAMCDTPEEAERVLAPLRACPIADRAVLHETGLTTVEQENEAQAAAESRESPLRRRLHLDRRSRRRVSSAPARAVVRVADRALLLDLVRLGAEPAVAGHGVLDRGACLHCDVRNLERPGRRRPPP